MGSWRNIIRDCAVQNYVAMIANILSPSRLDIKLTGARQIRFDGRVK